MDLDLAELKNAARLGARKKSDAALTVIEVVVAAAIASAAAFAFYSAMIIGYAIVCSTQHRLEAEALAFDKTLEIFNTFDFARATVATSLPPAFPPPASLLPSNTEIRTMIIPDSPSPVKWDIQVLVKRDRLWPGGKTFTLTNDVVYRVTRYAVGRN